MDPGPPAPPRPLRASTAPHPHLAAAQPYRDEPDDDEYDEPRFYRASLQHDAAPLTMAEHGAHPPHAGFSAAGPPPRSGGGHGASHSLSGLLEPVAQPVRRWYREQTWTQARPKTDNTRRMQLFVAYAPDWIITLVTAGLLALVNNAYGFRREFSLTDTSLQHTYSLTERVTVPELVVYSLVIPIIVILIFSLAVNRSVWDFHAALLSLVLTHALTITATTLIKVAVGRPRPDIIDRCQPRAGAANAPVYGLVTEAVCTSDLASHIMSEGFRSFPSGHSSAAWAGLTFLSLYLAGKLHLFNRKGHAATAWLVFFPLVGAALISVSRTMDYRHHATDVIAGAILGVLICLGTYFRYYPSLHHPRCHKPWAPRVPRIDGVDGDEHSDLEGGAHPHQHLQDLSPHEEMQRETVDH